MRGGKKERRMGKKDIYKRIKESEKEEKRKEEK